MGMVERAGIVVGVLVGVPLLYLLFVWLWEEVLPLLGAVLPVAAIVFTVGWWVVTGGS